MGVTLLMVTALDMNVEVKIDGAAALSGAL